MSNEGCQPADFKYWAQQIMEPVWIATGASIGNLYNVFVLNMVSGYTNFGCQWFQGRINAWQAIIAGLANPNGIAAQRLQAKIAWAQQMHVICGCMGALPLTTGSNSEKIISRFELDLSDLQATTETRSFRIFGTNGSTFSLEIKNEDSYYYNFTTKAFQATKARLDNKTIANGVYSGSIVFPTVTDDDQYDFYLFAEQGSIHSPYNEVRFGDRSVDINSSTGSNSSLMQKVIYQYTDLTLTLAVYAPTAAFTTGSLVNDTLTIPKGKNAIKTPFSISCTSASTESFVIIKQPTSGDVLSFVTPTVGAAPENLPGEDIYPALRNDGNTVDGAITGGGSTIKVVMDGLVASFMGVGDKILGAVATDTVDGAVSSGIKVVMDNNVVGKMAIGDQITGNAYLDANIVTVAALDPDGDNAKEFSMSEAVAVGDGITLTFTPKCNRSLTTVVALNPDGDNTKEFSMSQNIGIVDGVTLTFSPQKNYQWPLDNINHIKEDMIVVPGTNVTASTSVGKYEDTVTIFEDTDREEVIIKNQAPALNTKNQPPTVVKGLVTVQAGNVVFDKQQILLLAGDALKIGGYGTDQILNAYGYEVVFTDLAIALTEVTTTTTAASSSSTSVALTARDGILNTVSTVSGIGIDPSAAAPTVNSGASATGAGTVVLSAAQTLESGITLTFPGAGKVATITGYIEVLKSGPASQTLRFDVEKLLTSA